jgi:uncharacterized protein (TIGR02421 family)
MQVLTEEDILSRIKQQEPMEAILEGGALVVTITKYLPSICTAIHTGHQLRNDLAERCSFSELQRLHFESPATDAMISSFPITLVVQDSRFEYDLNRPLARCIHQRVFGNSVWDRPASRSQISTSHHKHQQFFRILDALIEQLESLFKACILFDIHSYNHQQIKRETPTFNIGTEQIDMDRWGAVVHYFEKKLNKITLPNLQVDTSMNDVFWGRGYLIGHVNSRFKNTLVLPTEVKKIYLDETTGDAFPLVLDELKEGMQHAISETAAYFVRKQTRKTRAQRHDMYADTLDPAIVDIDRKLHRLAKNIVVLQYVNPTNLAQEMKRFFAYKGDYSPAFTYQQLKLDPYQFKEALYRLPTDNIRDAGIQQLYRQTINTFADKIDLLVSIGSDQFIYNSLRYYGEPSEQDLANAHFLLYAPDIKDAAELPLYDTDQMIEIFRREAQDHGIECKVDTSKRLVANAMVDGGRKTLLIRHGIKVTKTELNALIHHELGVHMVTTTNAQQQPLKIFSLGLPGNTLAQEGLAILSEYISGSMTLDRIKILALRVVAVETMIRYGDFSKTFKALKNDYGLNPERAFMLTARVHRGGGLTKDHLYLRGLREALQLYRATDITNLFIGKTGFASLPLVNELIARGTLEKPKLLPMFLSEATRSGEVLDYLVNSIREQR